MRKRIVPFAVALLLVVAGCSSSDPTASDEYQALEQELAQANRELAQMSEELARAEVLLVETATEHDASVALSENIDEVEASETVNIAAFLDKDLDALMDTYTEDVVFVDRTFGDHVVGRDEYRKMNADVIEWADPDATEVVDRFVSEDGTRAVHDRYRRPGLLL